MLRDRVLVTAANGTAMSLPRRTVGLERGVIACLAGLGIRWHGRCVLSRAAGGRALD
jgi:hypothetical protein